MCCCCDFRFSDKQFPADASSVGACEAIAGKTVKWQRATEIFDKLKPKLFDGAIEPADIAQGQLGDCWLLAAFAVMAE